MHFLSHDCDTRHIATPCRRPEDVDELCRLAEQQQRQQQQPAPGGLTRYQLFVRLVGNIYSPERRMPRALRGWAPQMALIFSAVTLLGAAFLVLLLYSPAVPGDLPPAPSPPPAPPGATNVSEW